MLKHQPRLFKKIFVVVPAYNEERSIGITIEKTKKINHGFRIVVVDDGSIDNTAVIAAKAGVKVISLGANFGSGTATKTGLNYAIRKGADGVILMDADGQHDPKYIPSLIEALNNADLVIGSRYIKKTQSCTSSARKIGTKIISFLFHLHYGKRIYDPTSGYRAMNSKTLNHLAAQYPVIFAEPETLISLIKNNFKIREVPVDMKPRLYGKSSISATKSFYLMWYIFWKIILDTK